VNTTEIATWFDDRLKYNDPGETCVAPGTVILLDYTNLPLLEMPAPLCVIVDWDYMNTTPDNPPGPTRALMDTVTNELVDVENIIRAGLQKSRGLQAARSEFEFDETNSTPQYAVFNLPVKQNIISANRPD
jgi:hypothetical protein